MGDTAVCVCVTAGVRGAGSAPGGGARPKLLLLPAQPGDATNTGSAFISTNIISVKVPYAYSTSDLM